jgi:hypothetical protein
MLSEERLRALEWAIAYLRVNKEPVGCRCAGSCDRCEEWDRHAAVVHIDTVIELVAEVRRLQSEVSRGG